MSDIADEPVFPDIFSETQLDRIIKAAGGLPSGKVKIERSDKAGDRMALVTVSRRAALAYQLNRAGQWFQIQPRTSGRATHARLAKELRRVELAALRLRRALGLPSGEDIEKMPPALRGCLTAQANFHAFARECGSFRTNPPLTFRAGASEATDYSGLTQLRDDVQAIDRIRLWAELGSKREHKQAQHRRHQAQRHQPDKRLQSIFEAIIEVWVEIFRREPSISPRGPLVRTARAIIEPLGVNGLTDNAIRLRLREAKGAVIPRVMSKR